MTLRGALRRAAWLGAAVMAPASPARAGTAEDRRGPAIDLAYTPPTAIAPACSTRHPVCVFGGPGRPGETIAALAAADRAWDTLTGALGLPEPDVDLDGDLPIYLVDGVAGGGRAQLSERDPRARFDRGTAFGLVDARLDAGCALDAAVTRAVAGAITIGAAPATDPGSARAEVEEVVHLAAPCAPSSDAQAWADAREFQSHPERTIVDPSSESFDRGASLFFGWLDETFAREPGGMVRALWSLAPTKTAPDAWRWSPAPTGLDVLRVSLHEGAMEGATLDDLWVRFALARARMWPDVREAWHVPWPDHARRLAAPEPVYPTGSSYVVIDHGGAPPGASLRIEAEWEDYGRMRWAILKLDASGAVLATLPVTSLDRGTRASMTVEQLEGIDRLVVVGVDVGSTEHAFDPDQGEWEPHGWLLTLEAGASKP